MCQDKGRINGNGVLSDENNPLIHYTKGFIPLWFKRRVDSRNRVKFPSSFLKVLGVNNGHGYILFESIELIDGYDNEFLIRVGVKK